MPKWTGAFEDAQFAPQLKPGYHRVGVKRVIDLPEYKSVLVILANPQGEVAESLPYDIRPKTKEEKEKIKAATGRADKAWLFHRFVGAFDFPNREWWEKPLAEREQLEWDPEANAEQIMHEDRTVIVLTSERKNNKGEIKAQIEDYWGPEPDSRKPAPVELGVGCSELIAPKEERPDPDFNDQVPF